MQDQSKRGFWGVIIPVEILDSNELGANEKIIYGYVASYAKMCLDSNERIAERLNVSDKTVQRALQKLQDMGYVYVEFLNGNSAKRRIYAVFENPRKLQYLAKKGLFKKAVEGGQNVQGGQNVPGQNVQEGGQNVLPQNRGEGGQNVPQRIKEEKEEGETEQKPNGTAGVAMGATGRPRRKDFDNEDDYVNAMYNWNQETFGA